ncbi:MAG: NAD(P)H-binding protein [Cyanobacteria bacterium REEB67]|nr:NAD(P)H-binding protein [Cyanobacteria bacterium REEB67]
MLLVIGGTGFLGSRVLPIMLERGYEIKLLTRGSGDWRESNLGQYRKQGIKVTVGAFEDDDVLMRAMTDVDAIINLSGSFRINRNKRDSAFEYVNFTLVEKLLALAQEYEVQRYVQVSCLGARDESPSDYLRTKYEGDTLVAKSPLYWTIFRPSYLFGERFPLLDTIRPLVTFKPFLPVVGSGLNVVAPVHVVEVANAIVDAIYMKESVGQVVDFVGPRQYTMLELLEEVRDALGLSERVMTVPSQLSGKVFDLVSKGLPKNTIDLELAQILIADSCALDGQGGALAKQLFGPTKVPLGDCLPTIAESLLAK